MPDLPLLGRLAAPAVHAMTFNLRRRMPAWWPGRRDRWENRRRLVQQLLAAERPTVLGVQEALPEQAEFVGRALGDDYGSVGAGRDADGGGERCTVYFDRRRLELLGWHQHALSETPHRAGSRSWGNLMPRIVVAAEFADRETGSTLAVFNTHLDPFSARSRAASADMLLELVSRAATRTPGTGVVVMGDFNAAEDSAPLELLTSRGTLRDAWTSAGRRLTPAWRTYSGYRPPRGGARIDHVLVGPGVSVTAAGINAVRFEGAAASDHEPVHVALRLPADAASAEASP